MNPEMNQGIMDDLEELSKLREENKNLRLRLLSAAGDDLCRLTQEEIKKYTSGEVQIPPWEEFGPSCKRFHEQIAAGPGVLHNCLTLAQLIAENETLNSEVLTLKERINDLLKQRQSQPTHSTEVQAGTDCKGSEGDSRK